MNLNDSKKLIRQNIIQLKKQLTQNEKQEKADIIFKKIEVLPEFKSAEIVLCYYSLPDELPTHNFIEKWYNSKTILLPVMVGNDLILKKYSGKDNLTTSNKFGVSEPIGEQFKENNKIGIIIVPGIAFDNNRKRLGRGKGFYDRLLSDVNVFKIGVGFNFQLIEYVPIEEHDVEMDLIVTD